MDSAINIHLMPVLTVVQLQATCISSIHPYMTLMRGCFYGVNILLHYTDEQLALYRQVSIDVSLRVQELGGVCKYRGACSLSRIES